MLFWAHLAINPVAQVPRSMCAISAYKGPPIFTQAIRETDCAFPQNPKAMPTLLPKEHRQVSLLPAPA